MEEYDLICGTAEYCGVLLVAVGVVGATVRTTVSCHQPIWEGGAVR